MQMLDHVRNPLLPHKSSIQIWGDRQHRLVAANESCVKLFGYKNIDEMLGIQPQDMRCDAVESAPQFIAQNDKVLATERGIIVFDIHRYSDGNTRVLITSKNPLYNATGEMFGVECQCNDIQGVELNVFLSRLLSMDKYIMGSDAAGASYTTFCSDSTPRLSKREEECLFFMVRGFSFKQIACRLELAISTVAGYVENIKIKLGCNSRQSIIDYAIANALVPFVPQSILQCSNLSIVLSE